MCTVEISDIDDLDEELSNEAAFVRSVRNAKAKNSNEVIENTSIIHARFVVLNLFELALEKKLPIKMISGRLNSVCFNYDVTKVLNQILDMGIEVQLLVTDLSLDEVKGNEICKSVSSSASGKLFHLNDRASAFKTPHFILVGDSAYRFETSKTTARGHVSFNKPSSVRVLSSAFSLILEKSVRVVI
jgi:hypothetical protein